MSERNIVDAINGILDWHWEHSDRNDRDGKYMIPASGIETMMDVLDRQQKAADQHDIKPCIAFWGPSQTGKSSLLARYLDGESPDGDDSALTWSARHRVRFSTSVADKLSQDVVQFNPRNQGLDASGVATRFYLPRSASEVDGDYPVEVVPATIEQILHAAAIGYHETCDVTSDMRLSRMSPDQLKRELDGSTSPSNVSRDAFDLLHAMCNVCELLALVKPNLFDGYVVFRPALMSSRFVEDYTKAWNIVSQILWHGNRELTEIVKNLCEFAKSVVGYRRVFVTVEVAAMLENINMSNDTSVASGLEYVESRDSLLIGRNVGGRSLSYEEMCLLQSLVGELRIPLNEKNLQLPKQKVMLEFLSKCDLVDLPGVTNKPLGDSVSTPQKVQDINLCNFTQEIYKIGKTLSIVYGQAKACGIDAFVVFVSIGGKPFPHPRYIDEGIRAWLKPFSPTMDVDFGSRAPLPIYVNMSLIDKGLPDDIITSGRDGKSLAPLLERIKKFEFANARCADFFLTSNIYTRYDMTVEGIDRRNAKPYLQNDDSFSREVFVNEVAKESLDALFDDGLGADYMLAHIARNVTGEKRRSMYDKLCADDVNRVVSIVKGVLPRNLTDEEKEQRDVFEQIEQQTSGLIASNDKRELHSLARVLKRIFYVDQSIAADVITPEAVSSNVFLEDFDSIIVERLDAALSRWVSQRSEMLERESLFTEDFIRNPDKSKSIRLFLEGLTSSDINATKIAIKEIFCYVTTEQSAIDARYPIMKLLNNILLYGKVEPDSTERDVQAGASGSVDMLLIRPFANRVTYLRRNGCSREGIQREPQNGDRELEKIVEGIDERRA